MATVGWVVALWFLLSIPVGSLLGWILSQRRIELMRTQARLERLRMARELYERDARPFGDQAG